MKILVTGANGFVGANCLKYLIDNGLDAIGIIRKNSSTSRLVNFSIQNYVKTFNSYQDFPSIISSLQPNVVIHTACCYGKNGEAYDQIYEANYTFGVALIDALESILKSYRFINISTTIPGNINHYAKSKVEFNNFLKSYALKKTSYSEIINIFPHLIYGPGDSDKKVVTQLLHQCHFNKPIINLTPGKQIRDFLYVDDFCRALKAIATATANNSHYSEIEVGTGDGTSIEELARIIKTTTNSVSHLNFGALDYRENEPMTLKAKVNFFSAMSGLKNTYINLQQGIEMMYQIESKALDANNL